MKMNKNYEILSRSPDDTIKAAKAFAEALRGGEVVLLSGELGAGKTYFVKGAALGLGVTDEITSPTFAVHNAYKGRLVLNHFDLYRLNLSEAEALGVDEYFEAENSVAFIEWWQNAIELLPQNCFLIEITGENERKISISQFQGRTP